VWGVEGVNEITKKRTLEMNSKRRFHGETAKKGPVQGIVEAEKLGLALKKAKKGCELIQVISCEGDHGVGGNVGGETPLKP